jgi:hypothetical protein
MKQSIIETGTVEEVVVERSFADVYLSIEFKLKGLADKVVARFTEIMDGKDAE